MIEPGFPFDSYLSDCEPKSGLVQSPGTVIAFSGIAPLSAPEPPAEPTVPQQQMSPEQIRQLQMDQQQYQQVQLQAQLQNEAQRYQQQLEQQGYLPDQAQSIARQHMQSRAAQMDQARQNEFNQQVLLGKQAASEHFAKQYNLTFEDMATLRMSNSPEQMEQVAKKISADRE